jgi:ParB-like chromosome segregation protein Spo0J
MAKQKQPIEKDSQQIEQIATAELIPYARNARTHSEQQVQQIAGSIQEFGFCNPVLIDAQNGIIAGHGRVMAAQLLKLESVPCLRLSHLTDAQKRAYVLADNRIALSSGWDEAMLANELSDLHADEFDLSVLGFDADELTALMDLDSLGGEAAAGEVVEDEVPEPPADPITKPGDLWILGSHRLLCGDSRKAADVSRLMAGDTAAAVLSDPPYGVSYVGKTKDALEVHNDGRETLGPLLKESLGLASGHCHAGGIWYIAAPPGPQFLEFAVVLTDMGIWRQTLVWAKQSLVMGHSDYHYQHEAIFYGWKPGAAHKAPPDRKQTTLWHYDRPTSSREHPTMKPVALFAKMIENSTTVGSLIYEPFGGSGTTLIAAEQLNRKCYGMEISPAYCDVIVKRWENLTGKTAVLEAV